MCLESNQNPTSTAFLSSTFFHSRRGAAKRFSLSFTIYIVSHLDDVVNTFFKIFFIFLGDEPEVKKPVAPCTLYLPPYSRLEQNFCYELNCCRLSVQSGRVLFLPSPYKYIIQHKGRKVNTLFKKNNYNFVTFFGKGSKKKSGISAACFYCNSRTTISKYQPSHSSSP